MSIGQFLCRDESERRRMVDVARRLRPGMPLMVGAFMVAGLSGVGRYGWIPLLPPAAAIALYVGVWLMQTPRRSRPEYVYAGTLMFAEAMLAFAIALGPFPHGYSFVLLAVPLIPASVIFPKRVVFAFVAIAILLMLCLSFTVDLKEVLAIPSVTYGMAFGVVVFAVVGLATRDIDDASRRSAFFDGLTGVLNRSALTPRIAELSIQTALTAEPVALIVADIDNFKAINDRHGHMTGDLALQEIALRLSDGLGAFDPVYRLGGEEFLVVLPGREGSAAKLVAERLWRTVRERPIADLALTMSFGVAATPASGRIDFDAVFERADSALYTAKRSGKDLVCLAPRTAGEAAGEERAAATLRRGNSPASQSLGDQGALAAEQITAGAARPVELPSPSAATVPGDQHGWTRGADSPAIGGTDLTEELWTEHVLELNRRLRPVFRAIALGAFAIIASEISRFGWHTLIAPACGGIAFYLFSQNAAHFRRPTRAVAAGWMLFQTSIALGFASAHGAPLYALAFLAMMVPGRAALFRTRAAAIGTAYTSFLMAATALYLDAPRVFANPAIVLFPIALAVTAGTVGAIIGNSAVDFRGAGIVDDLTGLLNRTALGTRLLELRAQAAHAPHSVGIIIADLDHFKSVNDHAGHSAGDLVLQEVAARVRTAIRTFDSAYRIGGEEFLVLLPDATAAEIVAVAERMHEAVRSAPCAGHSVTVSLGVAASAPGAEFVYEELFERADAALYEAKGTGRDRICIDGRSATPSSPIALAA